MSDDLDAILKTFLADQAGRTSPKPKLPKKVTYATDATWRLDSFVGVIYSTLCDNCGAEELSAGGIFKRSVAKVSPSVISMTRIMGLHELDSHPNLPRRIDVKRSAIMACPACMGKLNFVAYFTEPANAQAQKP